jgi:flagellar basal-body rod protein FlgC
MADFDIFSIAGSAMSAQSVRLNTVASNLANADTVTGSADTAYRARMPRFETLMAEGASQPGVQVTDVVESGAEIGQRHQPGHPDADENGYVYTSNVKVVEEMVNMISAARTYENSVEVLNTSKDLMLKTLELGR